MEIYLDACIAIYLVEEHPAYAPLVAARLRGGVGRIAYSPLVEMGDPIDFDFCQA